MTEEPEGLRIARAWAAKRAERNGNLAPVPDLPAEPPEPPEPPDDDAGPPEPPDDGDDPTSYFDLKK
jgi:hypothetical protein